MHLKRITISYKVILDLPTLNLDEFYKSIQLDDNIQCIQKRGQHKCNLERHKKRKEKELAQKESNTQSMFFYNCMNFIIENDTISICGKLFKNKSMQINVGIKNNVIDFDKMTKFVIDILKLNCSYTNLRVLMYIELWNINNLNASKINLKSDLDYFTLTTSPIGKKVKSSFSEILLTNTALYFRLKDFAVYESEKERFIKFIKKVYGYDLNYSISFDNINEIDSEILNDKDINISIEI